MINRIPPVALAGFWLLLIWYIASIIMNAPQALDLATRAGSTLSARELVSHALSVPRPVMPSPDRVILEMTKTIFSVAPLSPRSLVYHSMITGQTAVLGFLLGSMFGLALAIAIVSVKPLEYSVFPWIIGSQTVPILAIAPMVVVILGNLGLTGLIPKALISAWLCFFPVTIGMVKGLRSSGTAVIELMQTYNASGRQCFWKLSLPASLPFLFSSLKVAIATSVVGAIVAELPTGGTAGLGARLLTGTYYGQTLQIWAALVAAALLSLGLVAIVGLFERGYLRHERVQS